MSYTEMNFGGGGASSADKVSCIGADGSQSNVQAELNDIYETNVYSTEETKIGTYLGKDLFTQTFHFSVPNRAEENHLQWSMPYVDKIVFIDGVLAYKESGVNMLNPIPSIIIQAEGQGRFGASVTNLSQNELWLRLGTFWSQSAYSDMVLKLTVKYTKE